VEPGRPISFERTSRPGRRRRLGANAVFAVSRIHRHVRRDLLLGFCRQRGLPPTAFRSCSARCPIGAPASWDGWSWTSWCRRVPEKYHEALVRAADQCAVKKHLESPPQFAVRTVVNETGVGQPDARSFSAPRSRERRLRVADHRHQRRHRERTFSRIEASGTAGERPARAGLPRIDDDSAPSGSAGI